MKPYGESHMLATLKKCIIQVLKVSHQIVTIKIRTIDVLHLPRNFSDES
jgi:hypothetical protein